MWIRNIQSGIDKLQWRYIQQYPIYVTINKKRFTLTICVNDLDKRKFGKFKLQGITEKEYINDPFLK